MSDTTLIRGQSVCGLTADDYAQVMLDLLPRGRAWPRDDDAVQTRVLRGLAEEFARVSGRACDLLAESWACGAVEALTDWERVLGLPDPCTGPLPTVQQRQRAVCAKLASLGCQTIDCYEALALALGYEVEIAEFEPFRASHNACGDPLCDEPWTFAFSVTAEQTTITYFRAGVSAAGEPLAAWGNDALECAILAVAPAHTIPIFAYRDYDVLPFAQVGVNIPRNWAFQDDSYKALAIPEEAAAELASGLPYRGGVRVLTASLRDMNFAIPQQLTAGPSGALVWSPGANMDALALSIERLNAVGLVVILTCLDGPYSYAPKATWETRGDEEVAAFLSGWAGWFADRFAPHQLVLSPWNEDPDSDVAGNSARANKSIAAIRRVAPRHWIVVGGPLWSRDWSGDIAAMSIDEPWRVILDLHAYIKTDAIWAGGLAVKKNAADALGIPIIYGEISQKTGGGASYASPTDPTRLADLRTAFAAGRAAGIPMFSWNDPGPGDDMRVLDFVAPTPLTPRSLTWIAACRDAMNGI